jgi:hypothetical protein
MPARRERNWWKIRLTASQAGSEGDNEAPARAKGGHKARPYEATP